MDNFVHGSFLMYSFLISHFSFLTLIYVWNKFRGQSSYVLVILTHTAKLTFEDVGPIYTLPW